MKQIVPGLYGFTGLMVGRVYLIEDSDGLPQLKVLTGAEVIASAIERPIIEGSAPVQRPPHEQLSPAPRLIAALYPVPEYMTPAAVDRALQDGDEVEAMGGRRAVLSPSHTPGHLSCWQPERHILFCSDAIVRFTRLSLL